MHVSPEGVAFILHEEAADLAKTSHPHWPGQESGVTLGPGYDLRFRTPEQITSCGPGCLQWHPRRTRHHDIAEDGGNFFILSASCALGRAQADETYPDRPNPDERAAAAPLSLIDLWAKGRRCGIRSGQLLIAAHTLKFGDSKPVSYEYVPDAPHRMLGELYFGFHPIEFIYDREEHLIAFRGDQANPDHIYFPCFGPNPGWPPRTFPVDPNEKTPVDPNEKTAE